MSQPRLHRPCLQNKGKNKRHDVLACARTNFKNMVGIQAFIPSTQETETDRSLSLRSRTARCKQTKKKKKRETPLRCQRTAVDAKVSLALFRHWKGRPPLFMHYPIFCGCEHMHT